MSKFRVDLPVRDTYLPYGKQYLDDEDIQAVISVLKSDFLTTGPKIKEFEKKMAEYVGVKYAVAFSNGTAALHGACFAANIGQGDEVITTPLTFAASANCILYQGGKPVFADINEKTYNVDPNSIEKLVTSKTKAIIPVDYTGQPADLDAIMAIANKYNLIVIEDAAHALGSTFKDKKIGSISDMTMFSFHPVKHITTGEGGIITTNNAKYYEKLLLFRSHGITRDQNQLEQYEGPWYYEMKDLGFNYRMTDIQAALGSSQLLKIDKFVKRRREIANIYNKAFQDIKQLTIPYQSKQSESSWHLYVLKLNAEQLTGNRREIFETLQAENIGVNVHYIPVYLMPYYRNLGYKKGTCPLAEKLYEDIITIPLFPTMSDSDVNDVIKGVYKVIDFYKREAI
ncbi:spore coat protein [Pullulanibacillus camelliae]|uniref:Spore coat protein n=1 Tax=Pullulanibacillus camelliae TaxID=1707096 RepID=A0A8J2YGM4_9BACL|nr:UDP-4-amino-4,6-dideoxy-N-acetyl-beta-L-altrosamine transaminase [Pullulanibacillus camelliae]GGE36242.1 spore coat protein [Pullulanibacillus camelliae]